MLRIGLALLMTMIAIGAARAQTTSSVPNDTSETLRALDQVIEQNRRLEQQNRELMEQIVALRQILATQGTAQPAAVQNPTQTKEQNTPPVMAGSQEGAAPPEDLSLTSVTEGRKFGSYTPNFGFTVADTNLGSMAISIYSYARYLNQLGLDSTYTDAFGNVKSVQRRQDVQLSKVQIKFLGWMLNPKFRYFLYAWSSNANQGQGAQVVLAGNLNYTFNKHFTFSGGINALPGTRSTEGNFPFWTNVDSRHIADEFFRGSYTSGFWAKGEITDRLRYQAMIGNNMSTLGVDAGQLPNYFSTIATALVWMPSTGEFGMGFGDFEQHEQLATRLGIHFLRSRENDQSQPDTEAFDNTQLRLSDGTVIFTPGIFGPGVTVTDATDKMTSFDWGIKRHGFSLEGEYFFRWINDFAGPNTQGLSGLFDHGFQMQATAMIMPKRLQLYAGHSRIFGQYGSPWDARMGTNFFPWKNRVFRWNNELLYLHKSPVGYLAVPFPVGGNGLVFHTDFELAF